MGMQHSYVRSASAVGAIKSTLKLKQSREQEWLKIGNLEHCDWSWGNMLPSSSTISRPKLTHNKNMESERGAPCTSVARWLTTGKKKWAQTDLCLIRTPKIADVVDLCCRLTSVWRAWQHYDPKKWAKHHSLQKSLQPYAWKCRP